MSGCVEITLNLESMNFGDGLQWVRYKNYDIIAASRVLYVKGFGACT